MMTKLKLFDDLIKEIGRVAELSCNENDEIIDKDNNILDWTDCEYISLNNVIDDNINGVLIFGDATIEFHELNEDAYNWAEYPIDVIQEVLKELKSM